MDNELEGGFAYLDDITICGKSVEEHEKNSAKFLEAAKKWNLTINLEKSLSRRSSINTLGYSISHGELRPDPSRLQGLMALNDPEDEKQLKRIKGLFAYYAKWVPKFSEKISVLSNPSFPLSDKCTNTINGLKKDIAASVRASVVHGEDFVVETDASENALGAVLSQGGRPVAFYSRTLNESERVQSSVEKEACACVEAIRRWNHYLF